jgi:hypothetical protein
MQINQSSGANIQSTLKTSVGETQVLPYALHISSTVIYFSNILLLHVTTFEAPYA